MAPAHKHRLIRPLAVEGNEKGSDGRRKKNNGAVSEGRPRADNKSRRALKVIIIAIVRAMKRVCLLSVRAEKGVVLGTSSH